MMENARARNALSTALIFLVVLSSGLGAQEKEPLRLGELVRMAGERNPRIRAAQKRVEATRSREPGSGLPPDPTLQVGVMNLALPEFSANMPASMAPTVQAMQRFPIAGKLSLREEIARQSTAINLAASDEVLWEVRTDVATAFYRIYQVDRQIGVMERTVGLLRDFETVAQSLYAAGAGRQADVLRASVEVARMEAEIERLRAVGGGLFRVRVNLNDQAVSPRGNTGQGHGLDVIADDSGLCVAALGGRPGVRSRRFASDHGMGRSDQDAARWNAASLPARSSSEKNSG